MISITQRDEYGVTYCVDTFLTLEDAKDALWNLECELEDTTSASRSYHLQDAIAELRAQIAVQEQTNEEN